MLIWIGFVPTFLNIQGSNHHELPRLTKHGLCASVWWKINLFWWRNCWRLVDSSVLRRDSDIFVRTISCGSLGCMWRFQGLWCHGSSNKDVLKSDDWFWYFSLCFCAVFSFLLCMSFLIDLFCQGKNSSVSSWNGHPWHCLSNQKIAQTGPNPVWCKDTKFH